MNGTGRQSPSTRLGWNQLDQVQLSPAYQRMLDVALARSHGDPAWRGRKQVEARELLALSQLAPPGRLRIASLDLREQLRAMLLLDVPVPLAPDASNALCIGRGAVLGFSYPAEIARQAMSGNAFFQILAPHGVWLPQVHQPEQRLCVAAQVPAGTRVKSLIVMAYGALSMQSYQIDAADPAGVFDADIALWWQNNLHRYAPLTRTPLLAQDTDR